MNVKQLKEKLNEFPDDMDVFIPSTISDFDYGMVNSVSSKQISFYDEGDDSIEPVEIECLVLTED